MKRDWDLIRTILPKTEEMPSYKTLTLKNFDKENKHDTSAHVKLLIQSGILDGKMTNTLDLQANDFVIHGICWDGYELLDSIRNQSVWERVKDKFKKEGLSMTFDTNKKWPYL